MGKKQTKLDKLKVPYSSRLSNFRSFMLRSERYRSIQTEERAVVSEYLHNKKVILLEQIPHLHGN